MHLFLVGKARSAPSGDAVPRRFASATDPSLGEVLRQLDFEVLQRGAIKDFRHLKRGETS